MKPLRVNLIDTTSTSLVVKAVVISFVYGKLQPVSGSIAFIESDMFVLRRPLSLPLNQDVVRNVPIHTWI